MRRIFTHRRLLEWETAAEAEAGVRTRGPVDIYLTWTPVLSGALALLVWLVRPSALWTSLPILSLWALSPLASRWLNRPSVAARKKASPKEVAFLRRTALYT